MVLDYYNLKEQPFGVTPDPRYLYLSPTHREALASLAYGIQSSRGFMSIIAKPGMGKTTILFHLLQQLGTSARTVFLFQTLCSPEDLLRSLLRDLGVNDDSGDVVRMHTQLNDLLLAEAREGRRIILVIDEAQNLGDSALEFLRMLSNFETTSSKLMQIILSGQPQLSQKLASPHLLQLRQRVSIMARLNPFSIEEINFYLGHRLRVAGYNFKIPLFTPRAGALIAASSHGIPRNINNICFNAISLGYVSKQRTIEEDTIREVLDDLNLEASVPNFHKQKEEPAFRAFGLDKYEGSSGRTFPWLKGLTLAAIVLVVLVWLINGRRNVEPALASSASNLVSNGSQEKPPEANSPPDRSIALPLRSDVPLQNPVKNASVDPPGQPQVQPPSVIVPSATKDKVRPIPTQESAPRVNDPVQLWAQVKKENTNAEVHLAELYLDGVVVPKNCTQARILLVAASRKGNKAADGLLSDYAGRCP